MPSILPFIPSVAFYRFLYDSVGRDWNWVDRKRLSDEGAEPVGSTPEEYDKFTRAEIEKWIKVARGAGIQPE